MPDKRYQTFKEFYPYYLSEHKKTSTKISHIIGSLTSLFLFIFFIISNKVYYIPLVFVLGYGFAWIGHFVFEKNKPATFKYPLYSFIGDWTMLKDILIRKVKL